MKKLTAGIFTVLLATVAGSADAAVTSKAYVDSAIKSIEDKGYQTGTQVSGAIATELAKYETKEVAEGKYVKTADVADTVTTNGTNPVTSAAIATYVGGQIANKADTSYVDSKVEEATKAAGDVDAKLSGYQQTAQKDTTIGTNPTDGHYPETKAVKSYVDTQVTEAKNAASAVDAKLAGYQLKSTLDADVAEAGYIKNAALNGYATESFVTGKGYQTASDVNSAIDAKKLQPTDARVTSISGAGTDTNYPTTKAVVDYVSGQVGAGTTDMATRSWVTGQIETATADMATQDDVSAASYTHVTAEGSNGIDASATNGKVTVSGKAATATEYGVVKVDAALDSNSTNPVQNKAINTKLTSIESTLGTKADKSDVESLTQNALTADTLKSALTSTFGSCNDSTNGCVLKLVGSTYSWEPLTGDTYTASSGN